MGLRARQAQAGAQEAQQREAVYRAALQELTLFKSRTSAALLQVPHPPAFAMPLKTVHGAIAVG